MSIAATNKKINSSSKEEECTQHVYVQKNEVETKMIDWIRAQTIVVAHVSKWKR